MRRIRVCAICQSKKVSPYVEIPAVFGNLVIFKCSACCVFFQNPMPSESDLKKMYERMYATSNCLNSTEKAFAQKDIKQEKGRIREIEKFVTSGKILDFGASSGYFLSELNKEKWDLFGIEYSSKAVAVAKQSFDLNLIRGGIDKAEKFKDEYFDVVTMHSVFEHLPDPQKALKVFNRKMRRDGLLVLSVPNTSSFEFLLFKLLGRNFPGFIYEHTYYYNQRNISMLLKKNGFRIEKITSRHHSTLSFPRKRPLINFITFFPKLILEYTDLGGEFKLGNLLYVYAKKIH